MMQSITKQRLPNRWLLAAGGVLMQLALGAVYAWSVFRDPLMKSFGWSISEVTLTFSIAILVLGFASFIGGLWMSRVGPRTVGFAAGICYGLGVAFRSRGLRRGRADHCARSCRSDPAGWSLAYSSNSWDCVPDHDCCRSLPYAEPAGGLGPRRVAAVG